MVGIRLNVEGRGHGLLRKTMMKHRLGRTTAAQLATRGVSSGLLVEPRAEKASASASGSATWLVLSKVAPQVRGLFRTRIAG